MAASFTPRSVLITGANRGLGLEMVKQMAEGHSPIRHLLACCRDPGGPKSEALQDLAKRHPDVITIIQLDVTDIDSIKQCPQRVGSLLGSGGLNLLINNAAIPAFHTLQSSSPEDILTTFKTNTLGPVMMTKEFLPHLRAAAEASDAPGMSCSKAAVINVSSRLSSVDVVPQTYAACPGFPYRLSKAALNMATVCAAQELQQNQILFAVISPGWVKTDMGGEEADLEASESVGGLLRVMGALTAAQSGAFLSYDNQPLTW